MITPREILKARGIRPRKRLGQSFLQDLNVARRIVEYADIGPDETVIEIGAGVGLLTALAAARARRVIALDIDPRMTDIMRERLKHFPNVQVVETDVLQFDFLSAGLADRAGKLKIIGNLPYYISTPILFRLLDARKAISQMVLMLQKEVADRIRALPGNRDYGIPSVITAMFCSAERLLDVPAGCFYPEPKVTSSILRLTVREKPLIDLRDEAMFFRIVRQSFSKRRKTLLNNLRNTRLPGGSAESMLAALRHSGIDGMRRAETLTAEEFGLLSNAAVLEEKA